MPGEDTSRNSLEAGLGILLKAGLNRSPQGKSRVEVSLKMGKLALRGSSDAACDWHMMLDVDSDATLRSVGKQQPYR